MIKVFPNIEELNHFAAEKFVEIAAESIEKRGSFTVALAGGSTPKSLYQLLASEKFKNKIDWKSVYFFFGDERNVLPDADESNFKMANENLFKPLQISEYQIERWKTEFGDANKIAMQYQVSLISASVASFLDKSLRFDLILLGMGADGHTASLFPFTEALQETEKFAVANYVEKLQTTRLTLTFPVINNARNVIFLVAGADKAETLRDVLEGEFEPERLPSQAVRPKDGNLFWLLDENVAKLLKNVAN